MPFTKNQLKAIESSGHDVLVSAAAGSGKTTVLVERILKRILDSEDPVDIDRMLVLTFTKAAASQMRDKILQAIEKRSEEDPKNAHLQKQTMLIHNAQISTFHGFCQEIIRNHFYEIDADPQLRVADEGEIKLMQMDALSKVLEEAYENADDDFLKAVESYSSGKNDKNIEDIILKIYRLAEATPDPEQYLDSCEKAYDVSAAEELKGKSWFSEYVAGLKNSAEDAVNIADHMLMLCDRPAGPAKYREAFTDDRDYAVKIAKAEDYDRIRQICAAHYKGNLARISASDNVDGDLKEEAQSLRKKFYKITDEINKKAAISLDLEAADMNKITPLNKMLIKLTRDFDAAYKAIKLEKGVIDFGDMEHLAIRILKNNNGATAGVYRDRFTEIYVDEYQDSNLTQEEIISLIGSNNVFMVGDVKQSIYRFRMARPDLFLKKYDAFEVMADEDTHDAADVQDAEDTHDTPGTAAGDEDNGSMRGERIDLSDNFRSRTEVLDCVNEIFSGIMKKEIGGIEYDDAAALHYGGLYDEYLNKADDGKSDNTLKSDYRAELILADGGEELTDAETEAAAIATRIKELEGFMDVVDDKTGALRKLRYSDIVILLRSMSGRDSVYRDVLKSMGVPAYVTTGCGYFSAVEIETLLSFLAVIDNPLQDIPLAAVLKSVLGGYTDEELAMLKCSADSSLKNSSLYDILRADDSEKTAKFLKMLDHFRKESSYLSVYEILEEIIDGEYGDIARSGENGHQAEANLNMLLKKAEDFGKLSYKGLFHFLRYIDQIRKYEIDYGEAGISDETDNNVRIMTIHKSKGLEFPLVFVSALSKNRNTMDEKAEIITDPDYGTGLNCVDLEKRIKKSTLIRESMISKLKRENLAEEMRILYVALTRAKEKVIMVASCGDENKAFYDNGTPLSMCLSYLDMVSYANREIGRLKNTDVIKMTAADFISSEVERKLSRESRDDRLRMLINSGASKIIPKGDPELNKIAHDIKIELERPYSHLGEAPEYSKISVSELKKASLEEAMSRENSENDITENKKELIGPDKGKEAYVPDFIREQEKAPGAGTFYGTAFHRMAELWDYSAVSGSEDDVTEEDVRGYFDKKCELGLIGKIQLDAVRPREILNFIKSDTAKRMGKADKKGLLFREAPFTLGVDPGPVLIQGIIDAYWIEDGEIVILDYKTDRVAAPEMLKDRYHVQLEYYDKALNQLLMLPVRQRIIYSTRFKQVISV